ncbi:hypothetical protein J4419_04660 [Candidatus Woesearchaeota archaeon]|nr:hypothetical protein [Candidatus Woesearchaeota archaeon]
MRWKQLTKATLRMPREFANAFTCNTLDAPQNAFLDRFGKVVALVEQLLAGAHLYILVEESAALGLLKHLKPYASQASVRVEMLHQPVVQVFEGELGTLRFPQPIGYVTLLEKMPSEGEVSEEEYERMRIENNIPKQGIDFNHEMFLDLGIHAISFTKGCYLGQEVMARGEKIKPARKLIRILYEKVPEIVTVKGLPVGKVSSCCFSQKHQKHLCFALIKRWDEPIDGGHIL